MPSSHEEIVRQEMFAGMNRGLREHLLPTNQWRTSFGMRHFESLVHQVTRKKERYTVLSNHAYPVSLIASLPTGYENFGMLVGLTDSGVFQLTSSGATRLHGMDDTILLLVADGNIRRFGSTVYNNRLFFVNALNNVHSTDGTIVREIKNSPAGQYVEVFFEHVVVGRPFIGGAETPWRFQWSHLYDFTNWTPGTASEADHYDCVEHQCEEGYTGISGIRRLGPLLCVYTPSAIYVSRYVGLPRVMVTDAVVQDYGCGLPWGLAAVDKAHFFVDMRERSFFQFDGGEVREIGRPIKDYFFSDLSTNDSYQMRTYTYVDSIYKEIHWVYVSTASSNGEFDREVVFNYRSGVWWSGPVENIWSFCRGTRRSKTIDELTGLIDNLTGTVDSMSEAADVVGRVYGSRNGMLLRDEISADTTASLLTQPLPSLETGDFHYGDIQNHKEVNSMVIHSKYDDATGVDVFTATRNNIDDAVNLVQQNQLWVPTLPEQRLSLPRISGRIFRFKFVPHPTTTSTTVETRTPPLPGGFTLLAQVPVDPPPPPPSVSLMFRYTANANPNNYLTTVAVPLGSNRGMFLWLHYRKAHYLAGDPSVPLLIDSLPATELFSGVSPDGSMVAKLFYIIGQATGSINVEFANPAINGVFYAGRVHIVGVCVNDLHQTSPIASLQSSFNVQNNGFLFAGSSNQRLVAGVIVYSNAQEPDVPVPVPYTGSGFSTNVLAQTTVDGPYINDGMVSLGHVTGGTSARVGWTMDAGALGDSTHISSEFKERFDWWNVAVALNGL